MFPRSSPSPRTGPRRMVSGVIAALALVSVAVMGSTSVAPAAAPQASCFWLGPFDRAHLRDPDVNTAYPDVFAAYWGARFHVPAGARLELRGRFPHARYMSLNAYVDGQPVDALDDFAIAPDSGSVNPFRKGAARDARARAWTVHVVGEAAPAKRSLRARNTLYAGGNGTQEILLRVYVPDRGRDETGGAALPQPRLVRSDGSTASGSTLCSAINDAKRQFPKLTLSREAYLNLVNTPGGDPRTAPAFNPPAWEAFFNFPYALSIFKEGTPSAPQRKLIDATLSGGQYSNRDSRYIFSPTSRVFGDELVIEGRLPTFPRTDRGARRMGSGQVRYWSLCQNEGPATTAVVSCLHDSQLPLHGDRRFTIVVSTNAARPSNARARCGVAWLPWGSRGDGVDRPTAGTLIMRNLLAAGSFKQAIQRVAKPGQEKRVMGPFLPRSRYLTRAQFERRGC